MTLTVVKEIKQFTLIFGRFFDQISSHLAHFFNTFQYFNDDPPPSIFFLNKIRTIAIQISFVKF